MFKNTSVKTILLSIIVIFSAALALISGYSWLNAKANERGISELYSLSVQQVNPISDIYSLTLRSRLALAGGFIELQAGEAEKAATSSSRAATFLKEAREKLPAVLEAGRGSENTQLMSQLDAAFKTYFAAIEKTAAALQRGEQQGYITANLEARDANVICYDLMKTFMDKAQVTNNAHMSDASNRYATTTGLSILFLVSAGIALLVSWQIINQMLIKPLNQAGQHFEQMGKGDLSVEIVVDSKNEIGKLFA